MPIQPVSFEPAETRKEALQRAARIWGIQTEYHDIWGKLHVADDETLAEILSAFDVDATSREQLNLAMEQRLWSEWSVLLEPTVVQSSLAGFVPVQIMERWLDATVMAEFMWENGTTELFSWP